MGEDNNVSTARTSPGALNSRVSAEVRAQRAWTARVAGATWDQVAQAVGFADRSAAYRAVKNYFGQVPHPDADLQREMWRDRMEHLWRQSVKDAAQQKPGAVRSAVAVAQRAAQMDGLDAPTRHEVFSPTTEQIRAEVARLQGLVPGQPVEADIIDVQIVEDDNPDDD